MVDLNELQTVSSCPDTAEVKRGRFNDPMQSIFYAAANPDVVSEEAFANEKSGVSKYFLIGHWVNYVELNCMMVGFKFEELQSCCANEHRLKEHVAALADNEKKKLNEINQIVTNPGAEYYTDTCEIAKDTWGYTTESVGQIHAISFTHQYQIVFLALKRMTVWQYPHMWLILV